MTRAKKASKGREQRKRKHDEEQGHEQDELLLFREPVLTPIPSSGGHGDYHYLPIRFTEQAGTAPKALRCNKCRANLGVGWSRLGYVGYIVSAAMAFRRSASSCRETPDFQELVVSLTRPSGASRDQDQCGACGPTHFRLALADV